MTESEADPGIPDPVVAPLLPDFDYGRLDGRDPIGGDGRTSSFEPAALAVATEAIRSELFGRSGRWRFVNRSRRSGASLVSLEARGEEFQLTVPDL
ncbi:DUF7527 domain-containing protein [Haloplanus pelagicus]|jgi:hypothetical protein|uniref:DUF7527 domain-containing protein n=1 Tax=Haloplanus pelagicus TaxID=2949995 RepID=UPI00203FBEA2|nr:hypothetical protein [Haloplanus sp. HW8-1]